MLVYNNTVLLQQDLFTTDSKFAEHEFFFSVDFDYMPPPEV